MQKKIPHTERHRATPSKNFGHDAVDIRKIRAVGKRRQATRADDSINFLLCLPENFGMCHHGEQEILNNRDCLMVGEFPKDRKG